MNSSVSSLNTDIVSPVTQAQNLIKLRNFDEALAILEPLVPRAQEHPAIYPMLGTVYSQKGRDQDAVAAFFAGTLHHPNNPAQYYNLGLACRSQGLLHEAIASFTTAVQLKRDYEAAFTALKATIAERDQKVRALSVRLSQAKAANQSNAVQEINSALLRIQPDHIQANNLEAERLEKAGERLAAYRLSNDMASRFPQATAFRERCERLEEYVGQEFRVHQLLLEGKNKFHKRDLEGALHSAKAAIELLPYLSLSARPLRAEAFLLLGAVNEANSDFSQAQESYLQAIKCDEACIAANQGLLRIQHREMLEKRQATSKLLVEAQNLRKNGDIKGALQVLESAIQINKHDPLLHFLQGQCFQSLGNGTKALRAMEQSLGLDNQFAPASAAIGRLRLEFDKTLHQTIEDSLASARKLHAKGSIPLALEEIQLTRQSCVRRRANAFHTLQPIKQPKYLAVLEAQERSVFDLNGTLLEANRNFVQAIKIYEEIRTLQPRSKAALALWKEAKNRRNSLVKRLLDSAVELRKARNYGASVEVLKDAFKVNPQDIGTCLHMAVTLECARQIKEAMLFYEAALRLHPKPTQIEHLVLEARERARKWPLVQQRSTQARNEYLENIALARLAIVALPKTP